ncbi:hypothetical protein NQ651_17710 [Acinetobacter baumannii]|nr:hypothetical protein [Acinetobacter baumannii]
MSTYIFLYKAKLKKGSINGRIEAKNQYEAQQKVMANNLLIESVTVSVAKNQAAARRQHYEV